MGRPERFVLIAGGAVLAVVVLAVAVVVALGGPERADYDPASPEGVVQRYIEASRRGDGDAARALLSERAREQLGAEGGWASYRPTYGDGDGLMTIERTEVNGDRATVWLRIEDTRRSGITLDRDSWTMTIPLVRENGNWLIDDPYVVPF